MMQKKCGCLAENTKIFMADGSRKDIQHIRIGDMVWCNTGAGILMVANVWKGWEDECLTIRTEGGLEIIVTKDHPIHLQEGFLRAGELKENDRIMTLRGFEAVRYIIPQKYNGFVYNLDLEAGRGSDDNGEITMIANGIVVGDMSLQCRLSK